MHMPSGPRNVTTGIQYWHKADAIQGLSNGQALAAGIGNAWPDSRGNGHYLSNDSGGRRAGLRRWLRSTTSPPCSSPE